MNEVELHAQVEGTHSGPRATPDERRGGMAERLNDPFRAQMEAQVSERVTSSYRRHGLDVADDRQDDSLNGVGDKPLSD